MSVTWMNTGLDRMARLMTGQNSDSINLIAKIFTNDYLPSDTSTITDFQECILPGYAAQPFPSLSWSGGTSDGLATYTAGTVLLELGPYVGTPVTLYGFYVVDGNDVVGMYADTFGAPFVVPNAGTEIALTIPVQVNGPC